MRPAGTRPGQRMMKGARSEASIAVNGTTPSGLRSGGDIGPVGVLGVGAQDLDDDARLARRYNDLRVVLKGPSSGPPAVSATSAPGPTGPEAS